MSDIEDVLRRTFAAHEADAPSATTLSRTSSLFRHAVHTDAGSSLWRSVR